MDRWEAVIEGCQQASDSRYFGKVVDTAQVVLKEDLAHFEIELILETLLYEPVGLFNIVSTKNDEYSWHKVVSDAFKLLSFIVTQHHDHVEEYLEDIIKVCQLPYDPQTRKHVLQCVASVARVSPLGAQDATKYVLALGQDRTCIAPLAQLVGTICEHHPEVVSEEVAKIWRTYLNILESNKNTDTILNAVLHGLAGLFKHFGEELPMLELSNFYENLSNVYIYNNNKCEEICLVILEQYANLFRERLSQDVRLRNHLWSSLHEARGARALNAIYVAVASHKGRESVRNMIEKEILQYAQSYSLRSLIKYTALRILCFLQDNWQVRIASISDYVHMQSLEFDLRNEKVLYDTADAVACCIECNLPGSDKLLQTAVMFYTNLPAVKRREIVAHGILKAPKETRTVNTSSLYMYL